MAENGVETDAHNACGGAATDTVHGNINDFLVCAGLRCGVSEGELPCFTAARAEITLMPGSTFAVTHNAFSSEAGGAADGDGSHRITSKRPSYTKSASWENYRKTAGVTGFQAGDKKTTSAPREAF